MDVWRWNLKIMYNEIEIITRSCSLLFCIFSKVFFHTTFSFSDQSLELLVNLVRL